MTWTEKEVPSLELCKRLKELGFPQDGGEGWYWREGKIKPVLGLLIDKSDLGWTLLECVDGIWAKSPYLYGEELKKLIKAPTCRELLEIKEKGILIEIVYDSVIQRFYVRCIVEKVNFESPPYHSEFGEKLSDLLAKIRIWLAENGYVKFVEVKDDK